MADREITIEDQKQTTTLHAVPTGNEPDGALVEETHEVIDNTLPTANDDEQSAAPATTQEPTAERTNIPIPSERFKSSTNINRRRRGLKPRVPWKRIIDTPPTDPSLEHSQTGLPEDNGHYEPPAPKTSEAPRPPEPSATTDTALPETATINNESPLHSTKPEQPHLPHARHANPDSYFVVSRTLRLIRNTLRGMRSSS